MPTFSAESSSASPAAWIRGPDPLVAHCASNHSEGNTLASDVSARQKPELAEQIGLVEEQVLEDGSSLSTV